MTEGRAGGVVVCLGVGVLDVERGVPDGLGVGIIDGSGVAVVVDTGVGVIDGAGTEEGAKAVTEM